MEKMLGNKKYILIFILPALLLFLGFIIGPTSMIFSNLVNGIGQHLQNFVGDVFMIDPFGDNSWIMNWRVFYFAWFIAWTPFVGMFIARISKGRTIREFIIGVVIVPTVFNCVAFCVWNNRIKYIGDLEYK